MSRSNLEKRENMRISQVKKIQGLIPYVQSDLSSSIRSQILRPLRARDIPSHRQET